MVALLDIKQWAMHDWGKQAKTATRNLQYPSLYQSNRSMLWSM